MSSSKKTSNQINNNFHEKNIESAKNSDIVKGIKWNLSNSHKEKDVCDKYASQDLYGLGPGVYPPGKIPERHDGCKCYLTDVLYQGDELINQLNQKYGTAINNKNSNSNKKYYLSKDKNSKFSYLKIITIITIIFLSFLIRILL